MRGADDGWDSVLRGGANGMAILIMALSWWYKSATSATAMGEASSLCEDLVYVFTDMHRDAIIPLIEMYVVFSFTWVRTDTDIPTR